MTQLGGDLTGKPVAMLPMEVTDTERAAIERMRRTPEEQQADLEALLAQAEANMSPELKAKRAALAALTPLQRHVVMMSNRKKRMEAALQRPDYVAALAEPAVAALIE